MPSGRRYPSAIDRFNRLARTFRTESDRATAILSVEYINELLQVLLSRVLVRHALTDTLFTTYAPLSTFASKIDVGFALGLYQESIHRELHLQRKIRNEFAHSVDTHTFEQAPISDWCRLLASYEFYANAKEPVRLHKGSLNRTAFFGSIALMAIDLMAAAHSKRSRRPGRIPGSLMP